MGYCFGSFLMIFNTKGDRLKCYLHWQTQILKLASLAAKLSHASYYSQNLIFELGIPVLLIIL